MRKKREEKKIINEITKYNRYHLKMTKFSLKIKDTKRFRLRKT